MIHTYEIQGMHCHSCIDKIEMALKPLTISIEVTLHPPQAKLVLRELFSLSVLNDKLATVGAYRLIPILKSQSIINIATDWLQNYYSLILIFLYILSVSLLSQNKMHSFMAAFFLVFSGFKLLDLSGFANAYATYDLLAKRWYFYGYIYPFLELILGFSYLIYWQPMITYTLTIALMSFSSLGVIKALVNKQKIQCACLGTVLKLPMTIITLIEDLAMVVMAISMLFVH